MGPSKAYSDRAVKIGQVLRPLGRLLMRRDQAERAAQVLGDGLLTSPAVFAESGGECTSVERACSKEGLTPS